MIVLAYKASFVQAGGKQDPSPHSVFRYCEGHCHLPEPGDADFNDILFAQQYFVGEDCDECNAGYWTDFVEDDRDYDE